MKLFETYHNGSRYVAEIYDSALTGGVTLRVDRVETDGKRAPDFTKGYQSLKKAIRGMHTHYRWAEWKEL